MHVDTQGLDVVQAEMLAQHLYEALVAYPDVEDSATAILAAVLFFRHILTLAERQAAFHELTAGLVCMD